MTEPCPSHLIYVSDDDPGLCRKRWGRGFTYLDHKGNRIRDQIILDRIKDLVIPPAWRKVWICPTPQGHLQVTGMDEKNRKQYIYHPDWISFRQQAKFSRLQAFGEALPTIRKTYLNDLQNRGTWDLEKVAALVLYMIDHHYFRAGSPYYSETYGSFGATTLRRKHLETTSEGILLKYKAKSGKLRKVKIQDRIIANKIRAISELPGYEIFRYKNREGKYIPLDSRDLNTYLQKISSDRFTVKNFRTWGASKLALELYNQTLEEVKGKQTMKLERTLLKKVASMLGNTLTVCREYYVSPRVINFLKDREPKPITFEDHSGKTHLEPTEALLLQLLSVK